MLVSVIIPTFKEGLEIESFLKRLVRAFPDWQTILVDGNSRDGTVEQAHLAGVDDVLECEPSRGAQMKLGADYAKGKLLLFLHADSHLSEEAGAMLEGVARRGGKAWGAFRLRHNIPEGAGFLMRFLLGTADWRSKGNRIPYGDQGIFCTREAFEACGGMPEQALMEDIEFACRLRKVSAMIRLPATLRGSGRRFLGRPFRASLCWHSFPILYRLGVSPERLARWYGHAR